MICSCEGGWLFVSARWVEQQAPWPDRPPEDASETVVAEYAQAVEHVRLRRRALENSVTPCERCNPVLFARWAGGHLDAEHDQTSCTECRDVRRGKPVSGSTPVKAPLFAQLGRERKDLE